MSHREERVMLLQGRGAPPAQLASGLVTLFDEQVRRFDGL